MLKTVIIDDEDLIREGLVASINWNDLGFEIAGQASDGERAIELIQNLRPDIIVTDIRMPFMNGLELIEFIKPMVPESYIIIISGHDEFQYAQKALQLGVYDFILKPFELDYFVKVLTKIKYDYTIKKSSNRSVLPKEDVESLKIGFLKSICLNKIDDDQIINRLRIYDLQYLEERLFATIIVQIDNYHISISDNTFDEINDVHKVYHQLIESVVKGEEKIHLIEGNSGDIILLLNSTNELDLYNKISNLTTQLRCVFDNESNLSVTIAYSQIVNSIYNIHKSYKQSYKACNQRFVIGYNHNISYDITESHQNNHIAKSNVPQIKFDRKAFSDVIKEGDNCKISEYIDSIFSEMSNKGGGSALFGTMFVTSVYIELLNILENQDLTIGDLYDDPIAIYKHLSISKNIDDSRELITEIAEKVAHHLSLTGSEQYDMRIKEAINYIEKNFANPNITLQEVAEHINMGVCYFSSTFKKETGDSFINYLNNTRIEKAKDLFEKTSYKAYEISYMVGYKTPTYFSSLFKKILGISPTEYKTQKLIAD